MHGFKSLTNLFILLEGQQPNALQQTTIQVIPQATCNQFWIQSPSPILNQHVCAAATGKDTCHVSQIVCKN
jgi:hypothetical protein